MRLFISTAYSSGSSFETGLAKPFTTMVRASSSEQPRLMRYRIVSSEMRPIVASWPTEAVRLRTSIAGMVSERLMSSSMRDWHETVQRALSAWRPTTTELRKVLTPPSFEMDLALMDARVSRPLRMTLHPVSRSWFAPEKVMPVYSHTERSPCRIVVG